MRANPRLWIEMVVALVTVSLFTVTAMSEARAKAGQDGQDGKESTSDTKTDRVPIGGRVIDRQGRPAIDAVVRIQSESVLKGVDLQATTDKEGRFEASVNAEPNGVPSLLVRASSADGSQLGLFRFPPGAEQPATEALEIKLEQAKTVTVKVVDADGKPVSGTSVAAQVAYPHTISAAMTDESGITTLRLPESERILSVVAWKDNAGLDYRMYRLAPDRQGDANAEAPEFPADGAETLTLSGVSPLTVQVVDDEQQPLADVLVYAWLLKKKSEPDLINLSYFGDAFWQRSDADGEVTFRWLPDWQTSPTYVWTHAEGFDHARALYDPSTDQGLVKIQPDRLVPIRGRVVDADGEPQSGITVVARGDRLGPNRGRASATTDAAGRYEMLVPPNQLYLMVVTDSSWAADPQDGFVALNNQPVENKDFTLRKATRVFGTLTNVNTGDPIPEQQVVVNQYGRSFRWLEGVEIPKPERTRRSRQPMHSYSTTTDENGRFEFALGDGEFDIRPPNQSKAEGFVIDGEEEIERDMTTVVPQEIELKGVVTKKTDGSPIEGALVNGAARTFRGRDWQATTNESGEFQVRRARDPSYVYVKSADGALADIATLRGDQDSIALQVRPVGSATGRVRKTDSQTPLAGVKLSYGVVVPDEEDRTWSVRFGETVTTKDDGTFRVTGLVPGWEYVLNLEHRDDGSIPRLGTVTVTPGETVELGDLVEPEPPAPYVPPTLEERIRAAFSMEGTPLQRYERASELAKLANQHLLVVFGIPKDPRIRRLMEIRFQDRDFNPLRDEFRFMAVPTDEEQLVTAMDLADALGVTMTEDQQNFLLVLLDRDGETVAVGNRETLCDESDLSKEKLLELLRSLIGDPPVAKEVLREALQQAAEEDKRVIVQETATWCGPCHRLSRFLEHHRVWEQDYVWVKIDHRYEGARRLMAEMRDGAEGGIPWFAILDAAGEVLATSNDPETKRNIGYPVSTEEQKHFANMLNQTRKRLSEDEVQQLIQVLEAEQSD